MSKKYMLAGILLILILLSGCNRPYEGAPVAATTNPDETFADDGALTMEAIKTKSAAQSQGTTDPAQLTAVALTVTASGGTAITPQTLITFTPTPIIGGQLTTVPSNTPGAVCTPSACAAGQTLICPSGNCTGGCGMVCAAVTSTFTPLPQGARPGTYILQPGEFPYCIARRFNVDPDQLLALSGLSAGVIYPSGTALKIPQSGSFPGTRALRAHPTTYTVTSADENIYSIACLFGDVTPEAIAQQNGLAVSAAALPVGKQLNIP